MGRTDPPPEQSRPTGRDDALVPEGESVAWSALGSLLAGPLVWGGLGMLADHVLGTGPLLTILGVVVGFLVSFYIVYLRFGRDD